MVLAQHPHPNPRLSTCSALASWASSGSVPLGAATIPPFILSLCVSFSQALSVSYLVLRLLVRACRQEELHGGGVTVERGLNESRAATKLYMRGKRMEDGVSERQKRGSRCACTARAWFGVCVHCGPGLCTCSNESTCVVRGCRRKKKIDKWTFSKQKEDESKHVASLLQPPPTMCACSFSISSVRSARK